jgi:hypothetical protein
VKALVKALAETITSPPTLLTVATKTVLTGETSTRWLAARLEGGGGILLEEPVDKVLEHQEEAGYVLVAKTATVFDGLN